MPDYPTTDPNASTPNVGPDADNIAQLLATLEQVPRDELPDGPARSLLAYEILRGRVDNLYRPLGCDHHNISWADRPAWVDPRQNIMSWILACDARQATQGGL